MRGGNMGPRGGPMNRGGPMHRGNMSRGGGGNMNRGGNRGHPGQVGSIKTFDINYVVRPVKFISFSFLVLCSNEFF